LFVISSNFKGLCKGAKLKVKNGLWCIISGNYPLYQDCSKWSPDSDRGGIKIFLDAIASLDWGYESE